MMAFQTAIRGKVPVAGATRALCYALSKVQADVGIGYAM
jgi:hypothetical protein